MGKGRDRRRKAKARATGGKPSEKADKPLLSQRFHEAVARAAADTLLPDHAEAILKQAHAEDMFTVKQAIDAAKFLEEHNQRSTDGCYSFPVMPGSALDKMAQRAAKEDVMTPELMRAAVAMGPTPEGALIISPKKAKRGGAR